MARARERIRRNVRRAAKRRQMVTFQEAKDILSTPEVTRAHVRAWCFHSFSGFYNGFPDPDDELLENDEFLFCGAATAFKYWPNKFWNVARRPVPAWTCCICFEECTLPDEQTILVRCAHRFHMSCINEWLKASGTCPVCRQK